MVSDNIRSVRAYAACAAILASACGRLHFDASPTDAATTEDGAISSDASTWSVTFGTPVAVSELNSDGADRDPSLTADELVIVFASDRTGQVDLWTASRASTSAAWNAPTRIDELSDSGYADTDPELSPDGLHVYFASQRPTPGGDTDVWESSRASRSDAWSAPARVDSLSTTDYDCCVIVSGDGLRAIMARTSGSDANLYAASRTSTTGSWAFDRAVTELDTSSVESNPFLSPGETVLIFDSDRPGSNGRDLYRATRPSPSAPFGTPARIDALSSSADDRDAWVSDDGQRIWFASDRDGTFDIRLAEAP